MPLRCRIAAVCALLSFASIGARAQVLTEPVGTTSAVQTATLTVTASGTLGAINVLTQGAPNLDFNFVSGGTCVVGQPYIAGQTCTVQFTFTPTLPGARYGGITLASGSYYATMTLGSTLTYGVGTGPSVSFLPGTRTSIANALAFSATAMAFDGASDVFVAWYAPGGTGFTNVYEVKAANGYRDTIQLAGLPSKFSVIQSIAIDGNGNAFLGDTYSGTVTEVFAASEYSTYRVIATNVHPNGLALDSHGNLFIADMNASAVREYTYASGYTQSSLHTDGASYDPLSIAFDSNDNLFVANGYTFQNVVRFSPGDGYTAPTIVATGLIQIDSNIVVDASENFILSTGFQPYLRRYLAANNYQSSQVVDPVWAATVVALDAAGNIYYPDTNDDAIFKMTVTSAPVLTFATTAFGQTSSDSPQTMTLMNGGNAPLTFSTPATGTNPSLSPAFTLGNSSTCPQLSVSSAPATLAAGATCTDAISFQPIATGPNGGQLVSTDNALNVAGATQAIPLTGNGLYASVSTLNASPNPATLGANVTLTAKVVANPVSTVVPTGTVAFYNGATALGTAALNSIGVATLTINNLPAGVDSLTCSYSGDSNFPASSCSPLGVDIFIPQTIVFSPPLEPAYAGTSVMLNAVASSGLPVTFTVISGPATVNGSVLHYNGAGTVVVEADQVGNGTYGAAAPVQVTVTATLLSVPVGTQSVSVTTLVTINTPGTLSAIDVLTGGAANLDFSNVVAGFIIGPPCTLGTAYTAGQTCIATFTFKPTHPGLRFGGISLVTNGAVVLGDTYVYGLGTGPQVTYSPPAQSLVGGFYSYPTGVAVDARGDVFLSDGVGNAVDEIPAGSGVSQQIGAFAAPDDVAVDGSGNVFVIYNRTSLAEVIAVNGVIPAAPVINVIATSFSGLDGMKVDGNGNVFVAEAFGNGTGAIEEVVAVNGSIPANPTVLTLVSGAYGPTGVAVDSAGNVYFSDEMGNAAWEAQAVNGVIPANPTVVALATGLNIPTNIALDAAGDVFVSEQGAVAEIVAVNGSVPANPTVLNLGANIVFAQGLAVDASGNVFIADDGTPEAVKLDFADAPSLTFAATPVGLTSTDSPQTVSLINDGNANLTWVGESSPTDPTITAGYTFKSTCAIVPLNVPGLMGTIVPGGSCAERISFTPVAPGLDSGKFTLTDNNLNVTGAQQNILLNGTGIAMDFSLTANPPSITIETQHHATMQLTLTSLGSFAGPVQLGCQGPLPPYVTCELPGSETLAAGQTLNFNFTMDTDAVLNFLAEGPPAGRSQQSQALGRMVLAFLLPLALGGLARRRKTLRRLLFLAVLVLGATWLTACGDKWPAHTPPGTYTIPVVGTATLPNGTVISHTLNITLTVTP